MTYNGPPTNSAVSLGVMLKMKNQLATHKDKTSGIRNQAPCPGHCWAVPSKGGIVRHGSMFVRKEHTEQGITLSSFYLPP